ncbi:MAG: hypothetical protein ILP12_00880 [Lachnospiraceae bacterium]|nr:hypothetical protein [Lachnospiraceae bacterium]
MRITADGYSFEIPDKWKDLAGARRKGRRTDLVLLWEEEPGCSGLLASLRCRKRRISRPDEYTELLGRLTGADGEVRYLYAVYGREGCVSEANEDLYWRLRDQLWKVFESVQPAEGCVWQAV